MKKISQMQRAKVLQHLDRGMSATSIARSLRIGIATVSRIRKVYRSSIPKSKGGRPAKLSSGMKRYIKHAIVSGKAKTAIQAANMIRNDNSLNVSADTVRCSLKEQGLRAFTKKKKPRLSARHKHQRLEFAKSHKAWTLEDWSRVIWSDETKINRIGSDGLEWV